MKVAKVLLRWYKSFNLNYMSYADRQAGVVRRPWSRLGRFQDIDDVFPFIEISIEDDITTVVGANESGKSHLLSAISKVLTGKGIPDFRGRSGDYARTDLCHYTSPRSKNAEDWPHVGLQFHQVTQKDLQSIHTAAGAGANQPAAPTDAYRLTLILAPDNNGAVAHLYFDNDIPVPLDQTKLDAVRQCLPRVEFIKSDLAISDQVPIAGLLAAYGESISKDIFDHGVAQQIATFVHSLTLSAASPQLPGDFAKQLLTWKNTLGNARLNDKAKAELEALLFRDVMGIEAGTLKFVEGLPIDDRTHADSLTAKWNREIDERLNLSSFWQQDDSFALRVNYKQGVLYFEITDKTGATYTFRERSSGLRYFLSYYIQAKALEMTSRGRNAIVLMDEPDSFLSILGQRNLLSVFESLVRAESSRQACQLVYTTHSPFLINRNYPRRLRLVRKGDAEEGTQLIDRGMLRRYEPVRSALGIDCAQTLFMGATNVVVEGPTDQFLLAELIRRFVTPDNVSELLDLNSVVMVSAESAPSVEKVLAASQWGDEPVPATVVLLDSDDEGDLTKRRITGLERNCKKLIEPSFVLQLGQLLEVSSTPARTTTTEDLIPPSLYAAAVLRFAQKWHPDRCSTSGNQLATALGDASYGAGGLVVATSRIMNDLVHDAPKAYDKMGVLYEVVQLLHEMPQPLCDAVDELRERLLKVCHQVRRAILASQQAARRDSGKQAIQRLIDDYFKTHKEGTSVFDVQLLLERLDRDAKLLGEDGERLEASLSRLLQEVTKARLASHKHFLAADWQRWKQVIEAIRRNPLETEVVIDSDGAVSVRALSAPAALVEPKPVAASIANAPIPRPD